MNLYVVMGVSGCGKSTVAEALAKRASGVFLDADDFHPHANKQKMASGIPLTDDDRWGWLDKLNLELRKLSGNPKPVFLACSALREAYRQRLRNGLSEMTFIYLRGSKECIAGRLAGRAGHFMAPELLESQFATLEEPSDAITAAITKSMPEVTEEIAKKIGLR
jgi:carbohydrate kinase (thermoresistant glucokinase family)